MVFPAGEPFHSQLQALVGYLGGALAGEYGAFLLLEVWPAERGQSFGIHSPPAVARSNRRGKC